MKKIIILISIFVIGLAIGLGIGVYLSKTLKNLINFDYICDIETTEWSDCSNGEWVATNMGIKEKISSEGDIIPAKSKLYKGFEKKISTLKYGNTKNGCDGNLLFSSKENKILKIKDNKENILQEVDLSHKGLVTLQNGNQIEFSPEKTRPCTKIESLKSSDKIKKRQ